MSNETITYEAAIAEVEAIVARLESAETGVDGLAAQVKRASELIGLCRSRLRLAEEDVQAALDEGQKAAKSQPDETGGWTGG